MNIAKKYIWTVYLLIWIYLLFLDSSFSNSDNIDTYLLIGWVPFLILHFIWNTSKINAIFTNSKEAQYLSFDLTKAVLGSDKILELAGITINEYKEGFSKWPKTRQDKWHKFIESKDRNLQYKDFNFSIIYLPSDNVFAINEYAESGSNTHFSINRSPNNTYLLDRTLTYHQVNDSNSKELEDEHIRLQARMRKQNNMYLISIGLLEFNEDRLGTNYVNILDFPFDPRGHHLIKDDVYEQFGFEIKRQSPWIDKDNYGAYTEHPWDTQIEYIHKTGAEITRNL